ncbi:hypothetical protein QUF80_05435 [Desulfococcaceae bacterium HSG8]|nr:hypothetical protein [Desulfococcaceae bacterium HSG8]
MKEPEYGWYGAGWASLKGGSVSDDHIPDNEHEALKDWLSGFFAAYADYPDEEAIAGMLQGDFSRGEKPEDALLRIAPDVYVMVAESDRLKREFDLSI